ncbi:MAG: hypothetical protein ACREAC_26480, partial [Blastocatellia bacterium]
CFIFYNYQGQTDFDYPETEWGTTLGALPMDGEKEVYLFEIALQIVGPYEVEGSWDPVLQKRVEETPIIWFDKDDPTKTQVTGDRDTEWQPDNWSSAHGVSTGPSSVETDAGIYHPVVFKMKKDFGDDNFPDIYLAANGVVSYGWNMTITSPLGDHGCVETASLTLGIYSENVGLWGGLAPSALFQY